MKPIGLYVAARELPGRDVAPGVKAGEAGGVADPARVRTLRATDRLTGMPVLVHVLPTALPAPQLPDHPSLLPYSDEGMDGGDAYLVTELSLHAVPASDPVLAARGALAGLAALHGSGLVHGGVNASQLWSVDGRVALAGAGLPWSQEPGSPDDDLRALADALAALGGVPEPLRALQDAPGTLTAEAALARLQTGDASESSASSRQPVLRPAAAVVETLPVEAVPGEMTPLGPAVEQPTAPTAPHDGTPIILGEPASPDLVRETASSNADSALSAGAGPILPGPGNTVELAVVDVAFASVPDMPGEPLPGQATDPGKLHLDQAGLDLPNAHQPNLDVPAVIQIDLTQPSPVEPDSIQPDPIQSGVQATAEAGSAVSGVEMPGAGVIITAVRPLPPQESPPSLPAVPPVSAYSNAPPGVAETPQERRKRQNDERRAQAIQDSRAAAERRAAARREQEAAQSAVVHIDFDDLPELPAPDSEGQHTEGVGIRFPDSVDVERVPASMRRPPLPAGPSDGGAGQEVGRLPARRTHGEPIRIGWAEDDSWRVVRTPGKSAPSRPASPRWLVPLLAAFLVLGGAIWAYFAFSPSLGTTATPAASDPLCCTVRFTVQGAAGVTARLTVLAAPDGANLTPGQDLGVAPGPIKLPVRGTYRLRVVADGYAPGTLNVTVPASQPITIDLGP
ncbi:hypothetical protein [Deinococcus aquatilis]|uniref:hypothetical protein n=1 Tax=Deinococcus aquatilis TaxID=519440 RepID=UPI000380F3D0|nr:hypothetical protein [Deinococcus aquatilis]